MSITNRPTDRTAISGTSSNLPNAYDSSLATYGSLASSGGTDGIANFFTFATGTPQTTTNTFVFHFYSKCTIGVGDDGTGSVTFKYTDDGGSNWYTLGTVSSSDGSAIDHSYTIDYSGTWLLDDTNLKIRVECVEGYTSGIPITWFTTTCLCYEFYVTYNGFYEPNIDQSIITSAVPIYSSGDFSTTTGALSATDSTPSTYTYTAGDGKYYEFHGSTEVA
jgi:hypothetical protein